MGLAKELLEKYIKVNEVKLNTLASACAKVDAIKDQQVPTNIAWVHSGLENQRCRYSDNITTKNPGNGTKTEKALNMSRVKILRNKLQNFLSDRKSNQNWKYRSMQTNSLDAEHQGYQNIKKGASAILNGDTDAIKKTSSEYVNNSPEYPKFRKDYQCMGKEMPSTPK